MRITFSITQSCGVSGFIEHDNEFVAAYLFFEEEYRGDIKDKLQENKVYPIMEGTLAIARINPSTCFIDKEVKVDDIYKGSQLLLINQRASAKSGTLDKQYFLINANSEDPMKELKKKFFEKNMKKLPLPVHADWEDFFWEGIVNYFSELQSHGSIPYKGYVLRLPSIETIQNLVEESHVKHEFLTRFKRVPKLNSLLSIADTENFDFKDWQTFLTKIGGIDIFTNHDETRQAGIVRAFELLGADNYVLIMKFAQTWHTMSLRIITIMLRLTQNKEEKLKIKRAFQIILEKYSDNNEILYPAINNFVKLYTDNQQNIFNKNFDSIEKFLSTIRYEGVTTGAEALAMCCGAAKVSERDFKTFENLYLKYLHDISIAPRSYPTIFSDYAKDYSWEILDMSVPKAWIVGLETYCCMHPGGAGGSCLIYAASNPQTSGVLRISHKGKTIAQSFIWLSDADKNGKRTFVCDNIETAGKEIREIVKDAYRDLAVKLEPYARLFGFKGITIGAGCSDIDLSTLCTEQLKTESPLYAPKPATMGYYDARTQWLLVRYN